MLETLFSQITHIPVNLFSLFECLIVPESPDAHIEDLCMSRAAVFLTHFIIVS